MSALMAIDPGTTESAYVVIDAGDRRPLRIGKVPNAGLLEELRSLPSQVAVTAIEMIQSFGMPVGAEVFQTVRWIGRFEQTLIDQGHTPRLVYRRDVKLHFCESSRAKDSNVSQALVDRFAPGQPNHGKGTKAAPGWFYGFKSDIWSAYSVAVYAADTQPPAVPAAPTLSAARGAAAW